MTTGSVQVPFPERARQTKIIQECIARGKDFYSWTQVTLVTIPSTNNPNGKKNLSQNSKERITKSPYPRKKATSICMVANVGKD